MGHRPIEVGTRIRELRKSVGLSIKELAEKVGVSFLTIHRIEVGKVSPSIAVLSEIAYHLNYPVASFVEDVEAKERSVILVKGKGKSFINSKNLRLKILAHKGVFDENLSITFGKTAKGEFINRHKHSGYELAYLIKGKITFFYGAKKYTMDPGDVIYYDGSHWHSVTAVEPSEFFNIHFLKEEK